MVGRRGPASNPREANRFGGQFRAIKQQIFALARTSPPDLEWIYQRKQKREIL